MSTRVEQKEIARVARMDWDNLTERLDTTATRGAAALPAGEEEALRQYFGDEEYEELKRLAAQTRATRDRVAPLGELILLPGIMGSNLATVDAKGDEDLVWINLLRLAKGQLGRLQLDPAGQKEVDGGHQVVASVVDKRSYTRAVLRLRARWNVHPFPYDWRKDLDAAADALAGLVRKLRGRPVHLVAHSMGGLVSRNFIRRHPELWEEMRTEGGSGGGGGGGRLIMLGTPNYGSFSIPQALTGTEKLVRWLSKIDLAHHGLLEVLEILNSFVGSYQLLPSPAKIPKETRDLYRQDTWGDFPVSATHLARAAAFHQALADEPATVDRERMFYVAGCNRQTLSGLEVLEPGSFRYVTTHEGDGRVPFALGLLDGVRTFYVEEDHGALARNDRVLNAVDQLLERGTTMILPDKPPASRAVFADGETWHRSVGEYLVGSDLERIARRADADQADAGEIRAAEEALTRAVLGETRPARGLPAARKKATRPARRPLTVEVVLGDVTRVKAPVVAVGSYKGVKPIAALGALDRALESWISLAQEHSMIGAGLGEVFFIPVRRKQIGAEAVLVAGMGEEGRFSRHDLRYLLHNVTFAVSALGVDSFATVLIGAGNGNLSLEHAVKGLLLGVCDALLDLGDRQGIGRVAIVEYREDRHREILAALERVREHESAASFELTVRSRTLPKQPERQAEQRREDRPPDRFGPRITIERDGDTFRLSALTRQAVVPVRQVELQSFFTDGVADRLMRSSTQEEQEMLGRLLTTCLLPEDFQAFYDAEEPLTLVLDRTTAAIPWEMACFGQPGGIAFFGTHRGLTRQFRTFLAATPGIAPPLNQSLRVLVVADPAPEARYQLPGARAEGQEVVRVLQRIRQQEGIDLEVISRIGPAECDPIEILGLILNESFDVVHFAGHGIYDAERPDRSGWVFGYDDKTKQFRTLSAREIFLARRVPRLVFSNACFSAVVTKGALDAGEMNRRLAGLAQAFFERGVPNYVGAGWPVDDSQAARFATELYAQALTGRPARELEPGARRNGDSRGPQPLSDALAEARRLIAHDGSTWGAYQHYGQADARLLAWEPPAEAPAAPRRRPPAKKKAPRKKG